MSSDEKADHVPQGAVIPNAAAEAQLPPALVEQPQDQPLSDKELDKVSGGVWRKGKWYPW